MGLFRGISKRFRLRGVLSEDEQEERPRMRRPTPTVGTRQPSKPSPTATGKPLNLGGRTSRTPEYRIPGSTPSTQRIHNPTRFR